MEYESLSPNTPYRATAELKEFKKLIIARRAPKPVENAQKSAGKWQQKKGTFRFFYPCGLISSVNAEIVEDFARFKG